MMKQYLLIGALLAIVLASPGFAESKTITKVTIAVAGGVNADFNASTGILKWSSGASGILLDDEGNAYVDNNISVAGQFSNVVDTSVGGQAMANFKLDSVTLTFNSIEFPSVTGATSSAVFNISSYNNNRYWESEIAADADVLNGQALVNVAAAFALEPVWGSTHDVVWDGVNDISCLNGLISLPVGTNIQNYLQNYWSDNNMIVLNADETTYNVPEPATLAVLGLGGLLLRRRLA
jgi:hypothetical protein